MSPVAQDLWATRDSPSCKTAFLGEPLTKQGGQSHRHTCGQDQLVLLHRQATEAGVSRTRVLTWAGEKRHISSAHTGLPLAACSLPDNGGQRHLEARTHRNHACGDLSRPRTLTKQLPGGAHTGKLVFGRNALRHTASSIWPCLLVELLTYFSSLGKTTLGV